MKHLNHLALIILLLFLMSACSTNHAATFESTGDSAAADTSDHDDRADDTADADDDDKDAEPADKRPEVLPDANMPVPAWAKKDEHIQWTRFTIKAIKELGQDLVKTDLTDAAEFCANYPKLNEANRTKVWVQLISAMAKFESSFQPASRYKENFKDDDGTFVISRGLLQISKNSANLYGCGIIKGAELETAETNLRCGVRILNTLVPKYHAIHGLQGENPVTNNRWKGGARYWSVLRGQHKDLFIRAAVQQMHLCKG